MIFMPENSAQQHENIDAKIVALLERLSTAVKAVLQEAATKEKLTPIQVEVLMYLRAQASRELSIGELVSRFQVSQPTISDVVRVLGEKQLIAVRSPGRDARVKLLSLTAAGNRKVTKILFHHRKLLGAVESIAQNEKLLIFEQLLHLAQAFRLNNLITVDKMCLTCRYFHVVSDTLGQYYCRLLNTPLELETIRVDCPEHEAKTVEA